MCVSVEIHSRTPGVGYTRFSYPGDRFTHPAHGGLYSDVLGDIELPQAQFYDAPPNASGRYKVARINGFVTDSGRAVDGNAVEWRIFGGRGQTSTGFSIADFRIFSNYAGGSGGKGGYYDSGPLHPGNYRCGITHRDSTGKTIKSVVKHLDINRPFERVDVPLDDASFWR